MNCIAKRRMCVLKRRKYIYEITLDLKNANQKVKATELRNFVLLFL